MRRQPFRSSAWRAAFLALAVVALLLRIASPPGTMLERTGHGARLVLCSGHGPMAMAPDKPMSSGGMPGRPSKTHSDGSCEFAAQAAHGLTTTPPVTVEHSPWTPLAKPQPIILTTTGSGLAAPPPPSQAPPRFNV